MRYPYLSSCTDCAKAVRRQRRTSALRTADNTFSFSPPEQFHVFGYPALRFPHRRFPASHNLQHVFQQSVKRNELRNSQQFEVLISKALIRAHDRNLESILDPKIAID